MRFRTAYDDHERVTTPIIGETMTKQSHKNETDINFIMSKYQTTGVIGHISNKTPQYGEFEPISYQEALNAVIAAQDSFEALPAALRKRFANDPGEYYEFVHDPENRDEMIKLGLITEVQAPQPDLPASDANDEAE